MGANRDCTTFTEHKTRGMISAGLTRLNPGHGMLLPSGFQEWNRASGGAVGSQEPTGEK